MRLALDHFEDAANVPMSAPSHRHLQCKWLKKPYTNGNSIFPWEETGKQRRERHVMAQPAAESLKSPNRNEILCHYTQLAQKASHC